MKAIPFFFILVFHTSLIMAQQDAGPQKKLPNIFIITTDGFRWQEVFNGADPTMMSNPAYVSDTSLINELYGGESAAIRRQKLLPFFWTVLSQRGQLYGNRQLDNNADVKNLYKISYGGYSEIFTGFADPAFNPNKPRLNKNINLPGYLNSVEGYKGKVAAFSSWNIFPYILNEEKNKFPVNSGYENEADSNMSVINNVQDSIHDKSACRNDLLTFLMAKQYIQQKHPKVLVLSLGETDEFAHSGRYDMYLQKANQFDKMLSELWYLVQTDPFYKNNTSFIITTDHGRGKKSNTWPGHHTFIKGSGEIWMAGIGYGISPVGEIKQHGQIYQNQIAQTIASLLNIPFITMHHTGKPIDLSKPAQPANLPAFTKTVSVK